MLVECHYVRNNHAETSAIIQAALNGVSARGSNYDVTHFPRINCSKELINAGIRRLIYHVGYRIDENAQDFLRAANI
jgi:dCMP deaminase